MKMVEERTPQGFDQLDDVISQQELKEISQNYKQIAEFYRDTLNARNKIVGLTN